MADGAATLIILVVAILASLSFNPVLSEDSSTNKTLAEIVSKYTTEVKNSLNQIYSLIQDLSVQNEESNKANHASGIINARLRNSGTKEYHSTGISGMSYNAMHDHANNIRTVGMGESRINLNGVLFRTRHNDFRLVKPHSTSSEYGAVEDIEFPNVPPEVSSKSSVTDKIKEMVEFFAAFKNQNTSHRDYRPYFRPVLCYLEGAWTLPKGVNIEDLSPSDRHELEGKTFSELLLKTMFASFVNRKNPRENLAYLPMKIFNVINGGIPYPIVAQWNYRILCHPLKDDLPLNRFRAVPNLASQMAYGKTLEEHAASRRASFQIDPRDIGRFDTEAFVTESKLDQLMGEIPGADNYQGNITDDLYGYPITHVNSASGKSRNAARYYRIFTVKKRGAMGETTRRVGYNDPNVYVALTKQTRIPSMTLTNCVNRVCNTYIRRVTYALPLEVIYLTPLHLWNPYNIEMKGKSNTAYAKTVTMNGRTGGLTPEKALNGTHERTHYITPDEFFSGLEVDTDSADTTKNRPIGVLDKTGTMRKVRASGTRIFLPYIKGVGVIRTRYPISVMGIDGNGIFQRYVALRDIVMNMNRYQRIIEHPPDFELLPSSAASKFSGKVHLRTSRTTGINSHDHDLILSWQNAQRIRQGESLDVVTSEASSHSHKMKVIFKGGSKSRFEYELCDGQSQCMDKHAKALIEV